MTQSGDNMYIYAYLRASTAEQDAKRAKNELKAFAVEKGHRVAGWYIENESGASFQRPELMRLLNDAEPGDAILVEQVDRLSRLDDDGWAQLKGLINEKKLIVISLDLPTSHMALTQTTRDDFTTAVLGAINSMMLDMLAAMARKDYDDRRRRQAQGIMKAKAEGKFKGRQANTQLYATIIKLRIDNDMTISETAQLAGTSISTVNRAVREYRAKHPTTS
jgi:DNA invertase Pin-like site-specific DNA recombinase